MLMKAMKGAAVKTKTGTCKQESDGLDKDLDEDQYYNRDACTYTSLDTRSENQIIRHYPRFGSDHVQHVIVEPAIFAFESTVNLSPEIGLNLPAADTTQAASRLKVSHKGRHIHFLLLLSRHPARLPTLLCNFQKYIHPLPLAWAYLARLPAPLHSFRQCCLLLLFAWVYLAQLPAPLHSFR